MSAINFKMDIERVEGPEGERVRITYEGNSYPTTDNPPRSSERRQSSSA